MPSLALTVTHCKNVEIQGHSGNDMQQQRVFGFCDKTCKVAFMVHAIKLSPEIGLPKRGRHLWSGRCYRSTTPFILPRTRMLTPPPPLRESHKLVCAFSLSRHDHTQTHHTCGTTVLDGWPPRRCDSLERHPCRRDSNPQSQHANGRRPTP